MNQTFLFPASIFTLSATELVTPAPRRFFGERTALLLSDNVLSTVQLWR